MDLSGWASLLSPENLLRGDFSGLIPIFYLAISIAIYSILIWHFYRFIAKRDIFRLCMKKYARAVSFLKYCFLFPFVAVIFFAGFALMLLFLTKKLEIIDVLSTSFAIIIAIRISAYYNEDLSKDVAKLLPFALLGVSLVDPSYFVVQDVINKINLLPEFFTVFVRFILFILIAEWVLRLLLTIAQYIRPSKKQMV